MPTYVIRVEDDRRVEDFVETSNNTLQGDPVAGLWFKPGSYISYERRKRDAWVVASQEVQFPPFWLHLGVAVFSWIIILFFTGFELSWWLVPAVLVTVTLSWHSKYFFRFMMGLGLRKWGYRGELKLLRDSEVLQTLLEERFKDFDEKGSVSSLNKGVVEGENDG